MWLHLDRISDRCILIALEAGLEVINWTWFKTGICTSKVSIYIHRYIYIYRHTRVFYIHIYIYIILHICVGMSCCCSVTKWHLTLCGPMNCSMSCYLPESAQTQVHWVNDAIQPSHPLSPPFPLALNLSQHQGLFQRVISSHQVAKVLMLQLQHQSFQWVFKVNFL